jgi:hypothetical protein
VNTALHPRGGAFKIGAVLGGEIADLAFGSNAGRRTAHGVRDIIDAHNKGDHQAAGAAAERLYADLIGVDVATGNNEDDEDEDDDDDEDDDEDDGDDGDDEDDEDDEDYEDRGSVDDNNGDSDDDYEEEEGGGVAAVDDDEDEDGVDDADNNGGSNGNKKRAAADDGDNNRPAQRQRKGAAVLQQDVDDDVVYLYTVVRHRNPNHNHPQTESARQVLQRVRGRTTTDDDVQAFRHPTRCG